jgi:hypothetical protein
LKKVTYTKVKDIEVSIIYIVVIWKMKSREFEFESMSPETHMTREWLARYPECSYSPWGYTL